MWVKMSVCRRRSVTSYSLLFLSVSAVVVGALVRSRNRHGRCEIGLAVLHRLAEEGKSTEQSFLKGHSISSWWFRWISHSYVYIVYLPSTVTYYPMVGVKSTFASRGADGRADDERRTNPLRLQEAGLGVSVECPD